MDKKQFTQALQILKESSKRKFDQSYELIINLKNIDLKNQNNQIDMFVTLPRSTGKKIKLCALVGRELKDSATDNFDQVITNEDFAKYEGKKKEVKKLSEKFDFFVAQATLMPAVAKTFGRVFGPRQRMPNPKAGCVVPPNANLKPVADKLRRTIRLQARKMPVIQCIVGKESSSDDDVLENMQSVFNQVLHSLPQEKNNIKSVLIKKTMSPAVIVGEKGKKVEGEKIKKGGSEDKGVGVKQVPSTKERTDVTKAADETKKVSVAVKEEKGIDAPSNVEASKNKVFDAYKSEAFEAQNPKDLDDTKKDSKKEPMTTQSRGKEE